MSARLTLADLDRLPPKIKAQALAQLYPNGIPDKANHSAPSPVMECDLRNRPLAKNKAQGGNSTKFLVRVTSFRRRLLDEDNLAEKYHVDCLRYAGLIPGDAPGQARIITTQEKVSRKEDERTEIIIEPLPDSTPPPLFEPRASI